jgi:hypothetical protein
MHNPETNDSKQPQMLKWLDKVQNKPPHSRRGLPTHLQYAILKCGLAAGLLASLLLNDN